MDRRQAMAQLSFFPCLKGMGSLWRIALYLVEMFSSGDDLVSWSTSHYFLFPNIDRDFTDLGKRALFGVSGDNGNGPKVGALVREGPWESGGIHGRKMKQAIFCGNQLGLIGLVYTH